VPVRRWPEVVPVVPLVEEPLAPTGVEPVADVPAALEVVPAEELSRPKAV